MKELKEYLKRELGVSDEEYQKLVESARKNNTMKNDLENLGDILTLTLKNDNELGLLLSTLLFEIEMLKARVKALEEGDKK